MTRRLFVLLLTLALPVCAAEGLIALIDSLDEPEGYCLDVPGWGRRLNLDAPLMAHTCKPGAEDELFTRGNPAPGQLYMKAYDLCVTAASDKPGALVFLKDCTSSPLQRFSFESNGQIRLDGSDLCMRVAGGKGTPTGGPSHLRRDLSLEACKSADPALSQWKLPESD
ncbi:MAG: RICIN domain-containing protein [Bryobacterales bacterium]|nr:RICIN domain-containing protein [Bryobacterales bacterium]MDE0628804.1 RICIN domain-containing protein [Bryobacterales bacterium]